MFADPLSHQLSTVSGLADRASAGRTREVNDELEARIDRVEDELRDLNRLARAVLARLEERLADGLLDRLERGA